MLTQTNRIVSRKMQSPMDSMRISGMMDPMRVDGVMETASAQPKIAKDAPIEPTKQSIDQIENDTNYKASLAMQKRGAAMYGLGIASNMMGTASSAIENPVASGVVSSLGAGLSGAAAGAAFGPIGAAVGGAIGLIGGAVKAGVNAHKQKKAQIAQAQQYASDTMTQNKQVRSVG